ncbi:MAG: HAMP domain-containing protein [Geminicoccaceae bacterium]|nr:HAMP domain-containing protein [Geminicoccaceae bacterium]
MGPIRELLNRTVVPRTLFWRSLLIVVLPLVVLQVVLTVIFYNRHWDSVTRWLAAGVAGEVSMVVELLEEAPDREAQRHILDRFRRHTDLRMSLEPGGRLAHAVDVAGIAPGLATHIDEKIIEAFAERLDRPFAVDLRSEMPARAVVYVQVGPDLLRVLAPRNRVTSTTTLLLFFWMVGASVVLIVIAVYFLRLQAAPIRELAKAVESFGKGRDLGEFQPRGPAEIRQAAVAFNAMRHRILRHIAQRTEMLAAISHDLRTPLTRMKLELEMLGDESGLTEGLEADVADMMELVETYLTFVRGEEGEATEPQRLKPLLEGMRGRAERAGAVFEVLADADLELPLRPIAFKRCLANLVDNATRHARWIRITAQRRPREVVVAIEDDGPGIPQELWERVFQPFFRGDEARRRSGGGTGLGLTIARDVVLGHGGEMTIGRSSRGGALALIRLPA